MFNENKEEYSAKQGKKIPVWQSDKYLESRSKAIEIIESGKYGLLEGDFWILMNETKSGKMAYTGLIISHNGCLKINDALPKEQRFRPECVSLDKEGYNASLVYSYCCPDQGLFEVGEVNSKNCKIEYPYAMAFKRMMDRVVLKNSKLAYAGIYSEVEADEFKQSIDEPEIKAPKKDKPKPEPKEEPKDEPYEMKEQEDEPKKESATLYCVDCQNPIVPVKSKKTGNWISEVELRNYAYLNYGKALCADCIKKYDAKKEGNG